MPVLPTASTTLAGMGEWAQPVFNSMLPYAYFAGGILLGLGLILFIIWGASTIFHHIKHN